jgi:glycosyltransferase involved in cell wall biosynthesis
MASLCFYTDELSPVTGGGIGVCMWDAVHALPAKGHHVTLIAGFDRKLVAQFNREYAPSLPGPGTVTLLWLYDLAGHVRGREPEFFSWSLFRSFALKEALVELIERRGQRFDLVEVQDWFGLAYYALVEKGIGRHLAATPIAVHSHGAEFDPYEAFPSVSLDTYVIARMEDYCLRHADWVRCPSKQWARACRKRYDLPAERVLISSPSRLVAPDTPRPTAPAGAPDVILCHGKLMQTKGVDLFVDAAVRLLADNDAARDLIFVLTGADVPRSPELGSHLTYLEKRIPARFQDRFEFTGHVTRPELGKLFGRALFGVVASRAETYGYAAHEMYAAGIPIIVSDIPAFEEVFQDGVNCLKFDGTVTDLCRQMKRLLADEALRARLRHPMPIEDDTLGGIYERNLAPAPPPSAPDPVRRVSAFVLAGDEERAAAARTIASVEASDGVEVTTWLLTPWTPDRDGVPVWLLGRCWLAHDRDGRSVGPHGVRLDQAAILVAAGDEVDPRFLALACQAFTRDAGVGMVASWHRHKAPSGWEGRLESFICRYPWEVMPELAPLVRGRLMSRSVFRCSPGITLDQWMDDRLGAFAEIALAWSVLEEGKRIYTIPEELVHCKAQDLEALRLTREDAGRFSLLLDQQRNRWLQPRLPLLLKFLLTSAAATAGPLTIERLGVVPREWSGAPEVSGAPAAAPAFYGKKWLLRQFVRELVRSPVPGFIKRRAR